MKTAARVAKTLPKAHIQRNLLPHMTQKARHD